MAHGPKGQGARQQHRPTPTRQHFDRDLLELERRKLVELASGRVKLTRAGYQAITELARRDVPTFTAAELKGVAARLAKSGRAS